MKVNFFIVIPISISVLILIIIFNRRKKRSQYQPDNIIKNFNKTGLFKEGSNNPKKESKVINNELWFMPIAPINKKILALRALPTYSNTILYDNFVYLVNSLSFRLTKDNQYTYSGKPIFLNGKNIILKIGNLVNHGSFDTSKIESKNKVLYGVVFYIIYEDCTDIETLNYIILHWCEKLCAGLYLSLWDNEGKAWFPKPISKEIDNSDIWKQIYDSEWANPLTMRKNESISEDNKSSKENVTTENNIDTENDKITKNEKPK